MWTSSSSLEIKTMRYVSEVKQYARNLMRARREYDELLEEARKQQLSNDGFIDEDLWDMGYDRAGRLRYIERVGIEYGYITLCHCRLYTLPEAVDFDDDIPF